MPQVLDFDSNVYLSITLSSGTSFFSAPSSLAGIHSSLVYQGQIGALPDVQLYSIPKSNRIQEEVLNMLRAKEGVVRADIVQTPQKRPKRGEV